MAYGVTGNTSGFGPEESRFDPQQANQVQILANEIFYCIFAQLINDIIMRGPRVPSFYRKMLKEKIVVFARFKQSENKIKILVKSELPDQGSNLDSSGPKPDVLPVTPSGNIFERAKIGIITNKELLF